MGKLTDKDMDKYRELFFSLPLTTSLVETVELGINSGIPIEYFIEADIVTEDNYTALIELPYFDTLKRIMSGNYDEREEIDTVDNIGGNTEDEEDTHEQELGIDEEQQEREEETIARLRVEINRLKDDKVMLEGYITNLEREVESLRGDNSRLSNELDVLSKEVDGCRTDIRDLSSNMGGKSTKTRDRALIVSSYANKGGVGKTTVAVSIAKVIADMGRKALICDFDYGGSNLATFFGIKQDGGNYYKAVNKVETYVIEVSKNLFLLPGSKDIFAKAVKGKDIDKVLNKLSPLFDVIVCDTCPAPYEKEYMHKIFSKTDIVYAIVNQSKFSREETRAYVPKMIYMGVKPENIRIILNQYNEKLADIKQVEDDFNHGLKLKSGSSPRIAAIVPEDWVAINEATDRGEIVNTEIWKEICSEIDTILK